MTAQPQGLLQRQQLKAILLLCSAGLLFSSVGVMIRLLSATVNNETIVFLRNLIGLSLILPWLLHGGVKQVYTRQWHWHLLRSLLGLTAMYCFFYCIAHMPLANAMLYVHSAPVFVPILGYLLARERFTLRAFLSATVGFVGVCLTLGVSTIMDGGIAWVGLVATFCSAAAFVCVRRLSFTESSTLIVFYFTAIAAVLSAIPMLWAWQSFGARELLLLVGVGGINTLGQWLLSQAYSLAPAAMVAPASYSTVIFAALMAWWFWGEIPSFYTIVGGALVLVALLASVDWKAWLQRPLAVR